MLTKTQKDAIRGMLADKQSAKTIAMEFDVTEQEVTALAKPKAALSSYMLFMQDNRASVVQELGGEADNATISRKIAERWKGTEERGHWDALAAKDQKRHQQEMAKYNAALAEEEVTPIDLKLAIGFTVAIGIAAFSTLPEPESSKHGGEH